MDKMVSVFKTTSKLEYAAVGVGVLIAAFYFKIVFGSFRGFSDSIDGLGRFGLWGLLNWEALKLIVWLLLSAGAGWVAYHQLPTAFPHWFHRV